MEAASSAPVSGLGFSVAVLVTSVALVLGLGWAARRLLGLPVGTLRVLIAGVIGLGVSILLGRSLRTTPNGHLAAFFTVPLGVPLIVANPNPNGYINPVLEWDTNNPLDGIAWSASNFGANNNLFGAVYGILDTGPESLIPTWPLVLRIEFLEPAGVKWSKFMQNIDPGPNAYQKPENRGGLERPNSVVFSRDGKTMYVVDYGEVYTNFQMPTPFYTVGKSGVIWTVTYTGG